MTESGKMPSEAGQVTSGGVAESSTPPPSGAGTIPAGDATSPSEPHPLVRPVLEFIDRRPALRSAVNFADRHSLLVSFVVLAVGMVAVLLYTSRDVGLLPSQLFWMIVATVGLAGACVWIISWD